MNTYTVTPNDPVNLSAAPGTTIQITNQGPYSVSLSWDDGTTIQTQTLAVSGSASVDPVDGVVRIYSPQGEVTVTAYEVPGPGDLNPSTVYVDPANGNDSTGEVAARDLPFATLAAAYAAASAGDTIRLLKGTHALTATLVIAKALTILGEPGVVVTGGNSVYGWDMQAALAIRDIRFYQFKGVYIGNLRSTVALTVDDCEFDGGYAGIYPEPLVLPDPAVAFTYATVRNSRFTNLKFAAIYLGGASWDDVTVTGNTIRNVQRRGIQIGANNDYTYETSRRNVIVSGNRIDGVYDTQAVADGTATGGTVEGIIVYGQYVTITGNHVYNCQRVNQETDCEGIYTKASFTNISDNIIVDSGMGEGSIDIKGRPRNSVQSITMTGFANADTFTLAYGADVTSAITYSAALSTDFLAMAAAVQAALVALPGIGAGNVLVSVQSYASKIFSVEFTGTFAGQSVANTIVGAAVAPSTGTISVSYPQQQHGFSVICANNIVRDTGVPTYRSKGITIKNESVLVLGNRVEGCTFGISTSASDTCRHASIINNEIYGIVRAVGATAGIQITSNADSMRIINNRIVGVTGATFSHAGIKVSRLGDLVEIRGNTIAGVIGGTSCTCIRLNEDGDGPILSAIIAENIFGSDVLYGIRLNGPVTTLNVFNNTFNTTATSKMLFYVAVTGSTTNLYLSRNTGLVSESSGVSTITSAATSRTINHGLNLPAGKVTLAMITLMPGSTCATTGVPYVSSVTDTQFVVTVPVAPGSTWNFGWRAAAMGAIV